MVATVSDSKFYEHCLSFKPARSFITAPVAVRLARPNVGKVTLKPSANAGRKGDRSIETSAWQNICPH